MFRPIRTILLIFFAFLAGVLYERNIQLDKCLDRGGRMDSGLCYGEGES